MPFGTRGSNVAYFGIDYSPFEIDRARRDHGERTDLTFLTGDATNLDEHPNLQGTFQVIVIRHPETLARKCWRWQGCIDSIPDLSFTWYRIFEQAFRHLAPGGILLVTTYTCPEFVAMGEAFTSCLGARVIFAAKNPFSAGINIYAASYTNQRDRYVTVFTRP